MNNSKRIYGIDIVRIVACISVYSQHYLGMELKNSQAAVRAFRESPWFKSVFGIFWGELVLIAFFVIAGFFITYGNDRNIDPQRRIKSCVYRCLNVVVPTVTVILFTALVTLIMKLIGMSDMFSIKDVGSDLVKVVIGLPGDKHIHYGYPLWFQHFILLGYIFGYAFVLLFEGRRMKMPAYAAVLVYTLINSEYMYMVFMGMLAGELCSGQYAVRIRKIFGRNRVCIAALAAVIIVMAAVYSLDYNDPLIYGPGTAFVSIVLILVYCLSMNIDEKKDGKQPVRNHKIIDFLSENSYACYLIHFFIFCSIMRIVYRITEKVPFFWNNDIAGCIIMYILMTVTVWSCGFLFTRYVLTPLKKKYDIIWRYCRL